MKNSNEQQNSILKKLKEIEQTTLNQEELKKAKAKAEREKKEQEQQAAKDYIQEHFPKTLVKSKKILLWLNKFWRQLDPELRKQLEIFFPDELPLYGSFLVKWNRPQYIYWYRGQRYMYDRPEYHCFPDAERLTKSFHPDIINRFHNHLYSGEFWKELDEKLAKKLAELKDK